ncbi:MAG: phosphotransferase [Bacteroidales bacterium]|nr:phosphotransferase [Bacteroidales bacterium]
MDRLTELFRKFAGCEPSSCTLLPLSGSARKYYRMTSGGTTAIGVIGTNLKENKAFLTIDAQMRSQGINAPQVYGVSPDGMAYIQEDLGDGQLFEILKPSIAAGEYSEQHMQLLRKTIAALPSLQFKVAKGLDWGICFPDRAFNERMVNFDLNYFKYDFLKLTGIEFDEIRLQDDFDALREDSLHCVTDTFMYRDFQARNVMIKNGEPCFIDFQGGRKGPVQYDLASFLWNAGTHFPAGMRSELENVYIDALGEYVKVDRDEFYANYRLITLVRLLQEMGAYGFRGYIERKQLFIDCVPTALGCIRELTAEPFERYPYLTGVLRTLANDWTPLQ